MAGNTLRKVARIFGVYIAVSTLVVNVSAALQYTLQEQEPAGTTVGNIKTDSDLTSTYDNATFQSLTYHLRYTTGQYALFSIDERRGMLTAAQVIDRESVCAQTDPCLIDLDITIKPIRYFQIIKVTVHLLDINDHRPHFEQRKVIRAISETILPNVKFPIPSAEDEDSGINGISYYELTAIGNTDPTKFTLETTGNADGTKDINLVLLESLDREEESEYSFRVTAFDGGASPKSGSILIDITVTDANDNNPVFDQPTYDVEIPENTDPDTTIVQIHATDADAGDNGRIVYDFSAHTSSQYGHLFRINGDTGEIIINGALDYETKHVYHLTVTATDLGPDALPAFSKVVVRLTDENDQPPSISINSLTPSGIAEVPENSPEGTFVTHASVSDPDQGIAGQIRCEIDTQGARMFTLTQIDGNAFKVVTEVVFDYEQVKQVEFSLTCTDRGTPPLQTTEHIPVHILDTNDHVPTFHHSQYYASFEENNSLNSIVTQVSATDSDEGQNAAINFSIRASEEENNNLLKIDPITGIIKTSAAFDYEVAHSYDFIITARDHGQPIKSSTAMLSVSIIDINDESPVFDETEYVFELTENQPIGSSVGYVSATDGDANPFGDISYFIERTGGYAYFDIITEDNGKGKLLTTQPLDRELQSSYDVWIVAHNEGYFNTHNRVKCRVDVTDENDNDPIIFFPQPRNKTVEVSNKLPEGDTIAQINATDIDIGLNAQLVYAMSSGNEEGFMEIHNRTGVIYALRSLQGLKHKVFDLTITVKDKGIPQRLAVADLRVIVDRSVAYGNSGDGDLVNKDALMIILGVVLSVLVLFVVIIVIVCCICYRQKRDDKTHKYNCRLEANKTLISSPASQRLAAQLGDTNAQQNSFNIPDDKISPDSPSETDYRSADDIDLVPQEKIYGRTVYTPGRETQVKQLHSPANNAILMNDLECSKMPDVVNLSHTEVDSECSGADSGKGTSEEGDSWPQNQSTNSSPNSDITTPQNQDSKQQPPNPSYEVTADPKPNTQNIAKQLYNLDTHCDLDPYQSHDIYAASYNRDYGSLSSFGSIKRNQNNPNSIHIANPRISSSPIYSQVGSVDKLRYNPQVGFRNGVDLQNSNPNNVLYSHSPDYLGTYQPGIGDSSLGITFGNPRQPPPQSPRQRNKKPAITHQNDVSVDSDTIPMETWMGREGSARGGDNRTRLFGSNSQLTPTQKSAFKVVGKNGTLKKNVRFADKNETLDISQDDASSVDALSDECTSITSGTYVLENGRTIDGDTFV